MLRRKIKHKEEILEGEWVVILGGGARENLSEKMTFE